jgi:hypothetical protein
MAASGYNTSKALRQSSKWRESVWCPSQPLGRGMQTITAHWPKIVLRSEKETAVVEVFYYISIRYWYYYHSVSDRRVGGGVDTITLCN